VGKKKGKRNRGGGTLSKSVALDGVARTPNRQAECTFNSSNFMGKSKNKRGAPHKELAPHDEKSKGTMKKTGK